MIHPKARENYTDGRARLEKGDYQGAAEQFQFGLDVDPRDGAGNRFWLFLALLHLGNFQRAEQVAEKDSGGPGRSTNQTHFQYGFVFIDYLKFKLGILSERELDKTLIQAMQINLFVPHYLLLKPEDVPERKNVGVFSRGYPSEALQYVHAAGSAWRRVPGLIEWLHSASTRGGSLKPQDDGSILFTLLAKGMVLVDAVGFASKKRKQEDDDRVIHDDENTRTMILTTNFADMKGQKLAGFKVPSGMKSHDKMSEKVVCFWDDEEREKSFISLDYANVSKVHFWGLLRNSGYFNHEMELERKRSSESLF